jgi:hypothetical protein
MPPDRRRHAARRHAGRYPLSPQHSDPEEAQMTYLPAYWLNLINMINMKNRSLILARATINTWSAGAAYPDFAELISTSTGHTTP